MQNTLMKMNNEVISAVKPGTGKQVHFNADEIQLYGDYFPTCRVYQ